MRWQGLHRDASATGFCMVGAAQVCRAGVKGKAGRSRVWRKLASSALTRGGFGLDLLVLGQRMRGLLICLAAQAVIRAQGRHVHFRFGCRWVTPACLSAEGVSVYGAGVGLGGTRAPVYWTDVGDGRAGSSTTVGGTRVVVGPLYTVNPAPMTPRRASQSRALINVALIRFLPLVFESRGCNPEFEIAAENHPSTLAPAPQHLPRKRRRATPAMSEPGPATNPANHRGKAGAPVAGS